MVGGMSPISCSFCRNPKPSRPGILRSVRITSASLWVSASRAALPSDAVVAVMPHAVIMAASPLRWLGSSSTIKTLKWLSPSGFLLLYRTLVFGRPIAGKDCTVLVQSLILTDNERIETGTHGLRNGPTRPPPHPRQRGSKAECVCLQCRAGGADPAAVTGHSDPQLACAVGAPAGGAGCRGLCDLAALAVAIPGGATRRSRVGFVRLPVDGALFRRFRQYRSRRCAERTIGASRKARGRPGSPSCCAYPGAEGSLLDRRAGPDRLQPVRLALWSGSPAGSADASGSHRAG